MTTRPWLGISYLPYPSLAGVGMRCRRHFPFCADLCFAHDCPTQDDLVMIDQSVRWCLSFWPINACRPRALKRRHF